MYTKKINQVVDGNQWKLALYNNMNGMFLFPPLIILSGKSLTYEVEHMILLTLAACARSKTRHAESSSRDFD
jgi:hypothetical protein